MGMISRNVYTTLLETIILSPSGMGGSMKGLSGFGRGKWEEEVSCFTHYLYTLKFLKIYKFINFN